MTTRRILVIDDEEAIQEIIQACLEDLGGWDVLVASSGSQGLLLAASEPLDGILLDVSMPEMNGFETLQKLQENPTTQKIPVTLLTARVQPEDKEQFAQLGIAGLILKPFDPLTLVEQVAEVFGW
jgi:two-component system, OmpR family, alkaline phosphatase synthesis response regulator PhoP